ncbi:MAG: FecR domain-containing protein, partial [bacterium]|nr:FecR domain-containing protein [bacterium]
MARGIEIDWVVIRVHTVRRLGTILMIALVAAVLVVYAYLRLNLPPDVEARQAIERAESAYGRVTENPVPDIWASELEQAEGQLESARTAYSEESWEESIQLARGARTRFEALVGAGKHELVGVGQVFSMEGRVTAQRAGRSEWTTAHQNMPVFSGDFVRTGRDGSAEIMFADGTLYRVAPNSLLEIHQPRRADEGSGSVRMKVGRINVYTSGSPSTVTTD